MKHIPSGYIYPFCVIMIYVFSVIINETFFHHVYLFVLSNVILLVGFAVPIADPRVRKLVGWKW